MQNIENKTYPEFDDDINLGDLLSLYWFYRKVIILVTLVFSFASLLWALYLPNIYQSVSLLTAEMNYDQQSSSGGSGFNAFSEIAGVSIGGSGGDEANLATATINSRDFLKHLIEVDESFLPNLIAVDKFDKKNNKLIYDSSIYNSKTKKWVIKKPSYIDAFPAYKKILSVSSDRKTGYVTISVNHKSPVVASDFIYLIFQEANSLIRARDLDEASASLQYLYSQLESVNQTDVLNAVNSLIANQLRKLTLANIKENYLLDPIDSPFIPSIKHSPKRLQMLILGTLLGFVLALISITIFYYGFQSSKLVNDNNANPY